MLEKLKRLGTVVLVAGALVLSSSTPGWAFGYTKLGAFFPNGDSGVKGLKNWNTGVTMCLGNDFMLGDSNQWAIDVGSDLLNLTSNSKVEGYLWNPDMMVNLKFFAEIPKTSVTAFLGAGVGGQGGLLFGKGYEGLSASERLGFGFAYQALAGIEIPVGDARKKGFTIELKYLHSAVDFGGAGPNQNLGGIMLLGGWLY